MYCKKCGIEQKEGQKYCPKCGTPYICSDMSDNNLKENLVTVGDEPQEIMDKKTTEKPNFENNTNVTHSLTLNEEKKVLRIAKAGMWIIVIAIVLTFVIAGFGFSLWWYIYLLILAFIAFVFFVTSNYKAREARRLNSNDSYMVNLLSWIGAIMLVILYLWGPLYNDNKKSESDSYNYEQLSSGNDYEWLTKHAFVNKDNGKSISIRLYDDGRAHMRIHVSTGYDFNYDGSYSVRGDNVILSFSGMDQNTIFEMDYENQRLYSADGSAFKQSAF